MNNPNSAPPIVVVRAARGRWAWDLAERTRWRSAKVTALTCEPINQGRWRSLSGRGCFAALFVYHPGVCQGVLTGRMSPPWSSAWLTGWWLPFIAWLTTCPIGLMAMLNHGPKLTWPSMLVCPRTPTSLRDREMKRWELSRYFQLFCILPFPQSRKFHEIVPWA